MPVFLCRRFGLNAQSLVDFESSLRFGSHTGFVNPVNFFHLSIEKRKGGGISVFNSSVAVHVTEMEYDSHPCLFHLWIHDPQSIDQSFVLILTRNSGTVGQQYCANRTESYLKALNNDQNILPTILQKHLFVMWIDLTRNSVRNSWIFVGSHRIRSISYLHFPRPTKISPEISPYNLTKIFFPCQKI